jgi:hypothetical protein
MGPFLIHRGLISGDGELTALTNSKGTLNPSDFLQSLSSKDVGLQVEVSLSLPASTSAGNIFPSSPVLVLASDRVIIPGHGVPRLLPLILKVWLLFSGCSGSHPCPLLPLAGLGGQGLLCFSFFFGGTGSELEL